MILDLSGSSTSHDASVDIFSDSMSFFHVGYGILAGLQTPTILASMVAAFTGYQVSQAQSNEPWERTGGEFIELALGLGIAAGIKRN